MPENHDPMTATLEALRSDVERTPLADSLAVRRRGDQRTRRRAAGSALVAVALVAGAVGYFTGGLTGDDRSAPPAKSAADAFLLAADQLPDPQFWTQFGEWEQLGPNDEPVTPLEQSCLPIRLQNGGQEPDASREFRAGPADGPHAGVHEDVYRLRSGSSEDSGVAGAVAGMVACRNAHQGEQGEESTISPVAAVPGGRLLTRTYAGMENAKGVDLVAVGAKDGYLVVLSLESPGIQDLPPTDGMGSSLAQALGLRTTSTQQTRQLAADPLLKPADIGAIGPYAGWQANPDPVTEDNQPSLCVPSPANLAAAEMKSVLIYGDPEGQVIEHALRFTNIEEADAALQRLSSSFAACSPGDPAEVSVKDRGPVESAPAVGDSETVSASRLSTPVADADISYYELGAARVANVLVVVQWSSMGKPDGIDWILKDRILTAAAQRAVAGGTAG